MSTYFLRLQVMYDIMQDIMLRSKTPEHSMHLMYWPMLESLVQTARHDIYDVKLATECRREV